MKIAYTDSERILNRVGIPIAIVAVFGAMLIFTPLAGSSDLANGIVIGKVFWFHLMMALMAIGAIAVIWFGKGKSISFFLPDGVLLLFVGITLATYNWELNPEPEKLLFGGQLVVLWFLLRFLLAEVSWLKFFFLFAVMLTGLIEAFWGMQQLHGYSYSNHSIFRLTGSFFNPGPYSGYLAVVLPIGLWTALRFKKGMGWFGWVTKEETKIEPSLRSVSSSVYPIAVVSLLSVASICLFVLQKGQYKVYKQWGRIQMLYNNKAYESVSKDYRELHERLKHKPEFLFEEAQCLSKTKQYAEAIRVLKRAKQLSSDPMIRYMTAKNHQATGNYPEAEKELLEAINIVPERLYPYYLLAKLYMEPQFCHSDKFEAAAKVVLTKEAKVESLAIREMRTDIRKMIENKSCKQFLKNK